MVVDILLAVDAGPSRYGYGHSIECAKGKLIRYEKRDSKTLHPPIKYKNKPSEMILCVWITVYQIVRIYRSCTPIPGVLRESWLHLPDMYVTAFAEELRPSVKDKCSQSF